MKKVYKKIVVSILLIASCLSIFTYIKYNNSYDKKIIYLNSQDLDGEGITNTVGLNYEVQKKTSKNDLLDFSKERYEEIKDNPLYKDKSISFIFKDKYSRAPNLGTVTYSYNDSDKRKIKDNLFEVDWNERPTSREFDIVTVMNSFYNEHKDDKSYTKEQLYKDVSLKLNENIVTVMDAGTNVSKWEWQNLIDGIK